MVEKDERQKGTRCKVCVYCGKCFEQQSEVDAVSGATSWGDAFKSLDDGSLSAPPPVNAPPGVSCEGNPESALDSGADAEDSVDAVTGATPGVATACKELGLDDMSTLQKSLGIKPPGVA